MSGGGAVPVRPVAPLTAAGTPIDEDAVKAAAKRLGAAKRPLIVAGGGALDASAEVTQLADMLQAPVLSYRRGRGVIDDRDPLSVNLPLGHELWAEADVVLAVGTHLHMPLLQWGIDRDLDDRPRRRRSGGARAHRKAKGRADWPAAPILRRLLDVLPAHNARRPSRADEMRSAMPACTSGSPSSSRSLLILPRSAPNCRRTAFSSTR